MVDLGKLLGKIGGGQISEVISWVGENKDTLGDVIDFVRDLPENVGELLGKLPQLLDGLGSGLADAGEQAQKAALTLVGADGKGGARASLSHGSDTVGQITEQLAKAGAMLAAVAEDIGEIGIPSLEPKHSEIMGFKVISGVDITTNPILAGPAGKLKEGADTISGVSANLTSLAGDLGNLSDILGKVGAALDGLGGRLGDSGGQIRGLMGTPRK